jgi:hypothetical protein
MDEHARRLDRLHSGQLVLCAQVKDLRESLPMQRRPLSRWAQQIHVQVLNRQTRWPVSGLRIHPRVRRNRPFARRRV